MTFVNGLCMQAVEEANEIKIFPDCLFEMAASIGSHYEVVKGKTIQLRNWLQARLTVYPPQFAYQNPVNLSKIIFSALNFFMHIFNMSVTYLPSIKRIR